MADPRFFTRKTALTLGKLAELTGTSIECAGGTASAQDGERLFETVAPLDQATATEVSFLDNVKYVEAFTCSQAGACFVRPKFAARAPEGMWLLVTEEPYYAYALAAQAFFAEADLPAFVSPRAEIAPSATIGEGSRVEAGAWIGANVTLGRHCRIDAGVAVYPGVVLGDHCRIGANSTLSHCLIGKRVTIHRGVHIGQDGFGFAGSKRGVAKVPQLGRVLIEDDVEIGSGTCIDRGAGPDTVIGMGAKIDNLVQIAHNVQIGRFVMIAAQTGIAGSSTVGDGVLLGGQVGISGHLHIGTGAKLAAQSGVVTDIPPAATFGGSPAVPARDWHRQTIALSRLTKKEPAND